MSALCSTRIFAWLSTLIGTRSAAQEQVPFILIDRTGASIMRSLCVSVLSTEKAILASRHVAPFKRCLGAPFRMTITNRSMKRFVRVGEKLRRLGGLIYCLLPKHVNSSSQHNYFKDFTCNLNQVKMFSTPHLEMSIMFNIRTAVRSLSLPCLVALTTLLQKGLWPKGAAISW